ncbi:MAG: metallophosphoesterase family protein [Deltaproteobacteria bacterium]|nr:MAG: metallophosphoesterase family protein [Deltaproteobacteria bacterium]
MRWALAALALLSACDKLRAIPGVQPRPGTSAPAPPAVAMGPWILDPQPTAATVCWVTDEPSLGRVWYGQALTDRLAREEGAKVIEHRVLLHGLTPGTQYRYSIEGGAAGRFTSAPEPGARGPIEVLVYGDNRTNSGDHALVVRAAAAEPVQLALHTGDMVVNAREEQLWRDWFREEADLLTRMPLIATIGNHEMTDDGVAYSKYFQRRDRPAYWSADYGPVHLIVMDSFERSAGASPHSGAVSDAQRAWIEEDLRAVPPDRHVWVLVHQGPYAHPAHPRPGHGGSEAVRTALLSARRAHPIEAVFAGHEHYYERGEIDGLKYFVLGGGGAPLDDPDPKARGVEAAAKALSYAVVEVCGCHARGSVKDIAGKVIDSFRLAGCAAACGAPLASAHKQDGGT